MQNFNHVAGGFAFAGIFGSFADINVFETFDTMAVVWISAVLPDIDHTKSIIGKTFYPLAKWIQRKYGHRTITHSIWFYIAVVCIVKGVDNLFGLHYALPVALAMGSHLIFDMCTKLGVPIFYPFSRRPAVLPANRDMRLSGTDFRSEAVLFVVFCCLNVFSYPLMAAGFWSRYNKSFSTWEHLSREVKRKPGDYQTTFLHDNDTVTVIMVEQKAGELIVWQQGAGRGGDRSKGRFVRYDPTICKLISFDRLPDRHRFVPVNLVQVAVDSVNHYMTEPVAHVTVQSDQELFYFEGPIMKKGTELTADYPNGPRFEQLSIDNASTLSALKQLELEHQLDQVHYKTKLSVLEGHQRELADHSTRTDLSDYEEGKRREKVRELSGKVASFEQPEPVNEELYRVRKEVLQHQLKKTARVNATLLIWREQSKPN